MAKLIHVRFTEEWTNEDTDSFSEFIKESLPQGTFLSWADDEVIMFETDFILKVQPIVVNCFERKVFVNNGVTELPEDISKYRVIFSYLATGMSGVADTIDYGLINAASPTEAIEIVASKDPDRACYSLDKGRALRYLGLSAYEDKG